MERKEIGNIITRASLTGIAAAGSLAYEAVKPSIAEASVCDPNKKDYKYTLIVRRAPFFEAGGKHNIFDKGIDPWIEMPITGGTVKAVDQKGNTLNEDRYSLDRPNVANFQPKPGEQNLAWTTLRWTGDCDPGADATRPTPSGKERTVAGKKVTIIDSQDSDNKSFTGVAASEGYETIWTGRQFKGAEQFLAEYNKDPKKSRELNEATLENIRVQVKELMQKKEEEKRLEQEKGRNPLEGVGNALARFTHWLGENPLTAALIALVLAALIAVPFMGIRAHHHHAPVRGRRRVI